MSRAIIEDIVGNVLTENYFIDINVKKNENKINILIKNPMQIEIIETILNQLNGNMYLKLDDNTKISLKNYIFKIEYDDDNTNRYISVISQFIYIGKEYVVDDIINIKSVTICFGDSKIVNLDFSIARILNWNFSSKFKNNDIVFKKNIFEIRFQEHVKKSEIKDTFYSFIELLWIFYGFVPNIKFIQYETENIIINEYFKMVYLYYTSKEFLLNLNKLIDISKLKNLESLISKWDSFKEEHLESFLGIMYAQMKDNKYSDMKLCNVLQSIDGFSQKLFKDKGSEEKAKYIDNIINLLEDSNYKEDIINILKDAKKQSFRERIKELFELENCNLIFYEEKILGNKFINKKNECKVFYKENKFLSKSLNERNRLSHMVKKEDLFSNVERKFYYWKYILLYRMIVIDYLNIEYALDYENYKINLESMHNWLIENKKCDNCIYLKNKQCELFKKGETIWKN